MADPNQSFENTPDLREELVHAREDLEDLEMYVQEFTAFLPLAVATVNPMGVVINVNSAFENLSGYSPLDAVGKKTADFFIESDVLSEFLQNLSKNDIFAKSTEITLVKKDGSNRTVNVTASGRTGREGDFIGFFLGINDITELKELQMNLEQRVEERTEALNARTKELEKAQADMMRALSEIKEERNKTYSLVTNLTDGLIFLNTKGVTEMINPQAELMLGIREEDVLEKVFFETKGSVRTKKLEKFISDQGGGGKNTVKRETLTLTEDAVVEVTIVPITIEEKETGRLFILHDVSREHVLDKLKFDFISVATHQMRTPLSGIKWAFELLLANEDVQNDETLKKVASNGSESTLRILDIVNNFLDVDAMESASFDYVLAPVDAAQAVLQVVEKLTPQADERHIALHAYLPKNLPSVQADGEKLALVLQNLIENAIKYTIKGSITVSAEARTGDMLITVSDTGIGIPEGAKKNIFSKFFRAENAKQVNTDGNGLGLYTTKRIVEKLGGEIWFESSMGQGSVFHFTIPLV